jgi:hypothetical protein
LHCGGESSRTRPAIDKLPAVSLLDPLGDRLARFGYPDLLGYFPFLE